MQIDESSTNSISSTERLSLNVNENGDPNIQACLSNDDKCIEENRDRFPTLFKVLWQKQHNTRARALRQYNERYNRIYGTMRQVVRLEPEHAVDYVMSIYVLRAYADIRRFEHYVAKSLSSKIDFIYLYEASQKGSLPLLDLAIIADIVPERSEKKHFSDKEFIEYFLKSFPNFMFEIIGLAEEVEQFEKNVSFYHCLYTIILHKKLDLLSANAIVQNENIFPGIFANAKNLFYQLNSQSSNGVSPGGRPDQKTSEGEEPQKKRLRTMR